MTTTARREIRRFDILDSGRPGGRERLEVERRDGRIVLSGRSEYAGADAVVAYWFESVLHPDWKVETLSVNAEENGATRSRVFGWDGDSFVGRDGSSSWPLSAGMQPFVSGFIASIYGAFQCAALAPGSQTRMEVLMISPASLEPDSSHLMIDRLDPSRYRLTDEAGASGSVLVDGDGMPIEAECGFRRWRRRAESET
ncbi:MAG: hypothetical protein HY078_00250 [Elusimicrobia bacterium]|nr:hypothetical protein [Elusimicrobiota bacterium]